MTKEYSGSKYTNSIKGTNAKAKANAATGLPEMLEIAVGKHFRKIKKIGIREMLKEDGIDMIHDLRFPYTMIKVN